MKFLSRLSIASLTFIIAVSGTSWWHLLRHREQVVKVSSISNSAIKTSGSIDETEEKTDSDGLVHEQGLYANVEYGYSVIIPDGLTAYRSPAPNPQHGAGIDLSKDDKAQVWVDGSYDSLEWGSLKEAAKESLGYLKDDKVSDIRLIRKTYGRLSSLRAIRFVAAYRESGVPRIEDEIIAIRKERDIVYSLGLRTTAARYSEDVKVLNQLQKTFRLDALPYP